MPRGVKIGLMILFALIILVLAASLYYNVILVFPGKVADLDAFVEIGEDGAARVRYEATIQPPALPGEGSSGRQGAGPAEGRSQDGTGAGTTYGTTYILSAQDFLALEPGDRVVLRKRGGGRASLVRLRLPSLPELVLEAERILLVEGTANGGGGPGSQPGAQAGVANPLSTGELRIVEVWRGEGRPGDRLQVNYEAWWERYPKGAKTLPVLALQPGEKAVLFLDATDVPVAGGAAVLRVTDGHVEDPEVGLRGTVDELREDVRTLLENLGRSE